jgi:hypothetical protein
MGLVLLGRQKYVQTAQLIVPELSAFEVEMAIEKVKNHITGYWSNLSSTE